MHVQVSRSWISQRNQEVMMASETITKRAFAAALGVHGAQVTRWAQMGMPVQSDGRIDPAAAAEWVRLNISPEQRQHRSLGAMQEARGEKERRSDASDELQRLGLWLLCQQIPGAVAEIAVQVGISADQAKALYTRLLARIPEVANEVTKMLLLPLGETGPFKCLTHLTVPDWPALEKAAAMPTDRPANRRRAASGRAE